jgi:hypothetical protein
MRTTMATLTTTACHLLPWAGKSWGEHSSNGWYLTTSPDHYRCHFIFVKATRAKRISDTVYFKHKHITQPTLSTEDLVIKAIQDLSNAIKGGSKLGSNAQMDAIKGLTDALRPGNQMPLHTHTPRVHVEASPRVHIAAPPRVQVNAPPRVQFNIEGNKEIHPDTSPAPPRLIVTSPKPILKQPTIIPSESIADRVKQRRKMPSSSIAKRVAQQRRESAKPVLDFDTDKLLEYRQLLRDPKHKEIWTKAGANEFGRLAQGVDGRIDGTNTYIFRPQKRNPARQTQGRHLH